MKDEGSGGALVYYAVDLATRGGGLLCGGIALRPGAVEPSGRVLATRYCADCQFGDGFSFRLAGGGGRHRASHLGLGPLLRIAAGFPDHVRFYGNQGKVQDHLSGAVRFPAGFFTDFCVGPRAGPAEL